MEILLFGDQQADCQLFLRHVFHLKGNPILTSFLDRVGSALREEISRQPNRYHHKRIPRFSTVRELVERHYASGQPNPAIESAIICLAQLSHFIWLVLATSILSQVLTYRIAILKSYQEATSVLPHLVLPVRNSWEPARA